MTDNTDDRESGRVVDNPDNTVGDISKITFLGYRSNSSHTCSAALYSLYKSLQALN